MPAKNFLDVAEPVKLIVLQVDEKRDSEGKRSYRPVFGLVTDIRPRPEYAGPIWVSPKPHQAGDIVQGGYNPTTGEMQSTRMANRTFWMGRIAQAFGPLVLAQGILMFFGFPEFIPVRVRVR